MSETFSLLCFQRIATIKQALNAHNISFFLRGGYWVLVTLADSDSGKYISTKLLTDQPLDAY